ncbi:unnamed protein product [Mycena citricolor]|uniref:Uncharacterized protein n=1 Tax=Mycena citricolor TaxID=2018698 RepID=A0AAD2Q7H7_9AGAR|nr:unnamed protein product [Mycena citricolor]
MHSAFPAFSEGSGCTPALCLPVDLSAAFQLSKRSLPPNPVSYVRVGTNRRWVCKQNLRARVYSFAPGRNSLSDTSLSLQPTMRLSVVATVVYAMLAMSGANGRPTRRQFDVTTFQNLTPAERRDFILALDPATINLSDDMLSGISAFPAIQQSLADGTPLTNDVLKQLVLAYQDEVHQAEQGGDATAGLAQVSRKRDDDVDGEEIEERDDEGADDAAGADETSEDTSADEAAPEDPSTEGSEATETTEDA